MRNRSLSGWFKSRIIFFGDVITELKKVVWPSRRDIRNLTTIVLIVSIGVGLLLGAIDFGFFHLVNDVFLRGR